jgi:uncharacterized protein
MTQQRLTDYRFRLGSWTYLSGMFTILSMFCLGAYAGRTNVFRTQVATRFKVVAKAACVTWFTAAVVAQLSSGPLPILPPQLNKLAMLLQNLSTTAIYVSGILLLFELPAWRVRLAPLSFAGRMALTNYLLQSVLATSIFYGTGLYGKLGSAAGLGIAILIFVFQLVASYLWLERFRFGPVEWLWRWTTYGERPPLRRSAPKPG